MKTQTLLKQIALFLLCFIFFSLAMIIKPQAQIKQSQQAHNSETVSANEVLHTKFSYKIIDAPNKTFGYDVYAGDHKIIHQTSVPALPSNKGFTTTTAAKKIAQLVIEKIKKGEMPPTVTVEEMKKLHVVN